jgi:hypothetical protein
VLTESDLDENVMSNDNCHGFAGLGSGTGERRHSCQPYFFGVYFHFLIFYSSIFFSFFLLLIVFFVCFCSCFTNSKQKEKKRKRQKAYLV